MSEMVERVAQALNAQRAVPLADWREWVPFARAAIAAMREPTADMVAEGWEHTADPCWKENVAAAWKAMIDAALGGRRMTLNPHFSLAFPSSSCYTHDFNDHGAGL